MSAELLPFKEPRTLAGPAAKLPAVFLPSENAAERFPRRFRPARGIDFNLFRHLLGADPVIE
jgi:hypothetical protein